MEGPCSFLNEWRLIMSQVRGRSPVLGGIRIGQNQGRPPHHEMDIRLLQVVVGVGLTEDRARRTD